MNIWMGGAWGTRERAIPGEWAALILVMVIGAAAGFLVLWFTMLRHERTVLHRARRRTTLRPSLVLGGPNGVGIADEMDAVDAVDVTDIADVDVNVDVDATVADMVDVAGTAPLEEVLGSGDDAGAREDAQARDEDEDGEDREDDDGSGSGSGSSSGSGAHSHADSDSEVGGYGPEAEIGGSDSDSEVGGYEPEPDGDAREPEPAPMCEAGRVATHPAAGPPAKGQRRKLTEAMVSRVEDEIGARDTWHYKELAALVQREFGVTVHPSSIRRAVKRRRARGAEHIAAAGSGRSTEAIDPASA